MKLGVRGLEWCSGFALLLGGELFCWLHYGSVIAQVALVLTCALIGLLGGLLLTKEN